MGGFDTKMFLKEKFKHRTATVPVPDLAQFFGEGFPAEWKVRGLTGQEVGRTQEAPTRIKNAQALLDSIVSGDASDKAEAIKGILGWSSDTPDDVAKRIEILSIGSVDPSCTQELAVRLCETFPIEFYQITNKINELTGLGQVPGKQKPSGKTQESPLPLTLDMPEGVSSLS